MKLKVEIEKIARLHLKGPLFYIWIPKNLKKKSKAKDILYQLQYLFIERNCIRM